MKKQIESKKYTVVLPEELAKRAAKAFDGNLTEAIRESLRETLIKKANTELLALKGKVKFAMSWQQVKDSGEE